MALDFHNDRKLYFEQQHRNCKNYILPLIKAQIPDLDKKRVLEIGCGEGGVLKPFYDLGCNITGIDLAANKIENARKFYKKAGGSGKYSFIAEDIYNLDIKKLQPFDLIILKDTIEHVHHQEELIGFLKKILSENGLVFVAFPPWQMPWGGHQQICDNRIAAYWPYYHLFPAKIYKAILFFLGESQQKIEHLLEIKQTRMTIERFEKILTNCNFQIRTRRLYLINPNYEIKFGIKPRLQNKLLAKIPFLRGFFTSTAFYLISRNTLL